MAQLKRDDRLPIIRTSRQAREGELLSVAGQLRAGRVRAGLSQGGLADRAGIAPSAVGAIERGLRRHPYAHTQGALAAALGLSDSERMIFAAAARRPNESRMPPQPSPAPLFGRDQELARIAGALIQADARLVTITGVGGCGKTVVALRVAADLAPAFRDGVRIVELAAVTDPALVVSAVAAAIGARDSVGVVPLDAVCTVLATRRMLLLLDNCEHAIEAVSALTVQLLAECPGVRILATSREPLWVATERQYRLAPLPVPDPDGDTSVEAVGQSAAVQLFVDRAQAVESSFRLTPSTAPIVAQLCFRLDGIPLALELAAARTRVLTLEQLVGRVDDAFALLVGASRSAPSRQHTLQATLDWSYALLTDVERIVFERLSIFTAGCDLDSAEAVCATPATGLRQHDVLEAVARLIDKSLVITDLGRPIARYRLLEPVRQYGARRLADRGGELKGEPGPELEARRRHAYAMLALAERAQLGGAEQVAWLARLDAELGNLRSARGWLAEHGELEALLRLGVALVPFWEVGYLAEGRRWLSSGLEADRVGSISPELQLAARLAVGRLAFWQIDLDAAANVLHEVDASARAQATHRRRRMR